jgi:pimeloyl-ACP methyl ester carboxylesterase
MQLRYQVHPGHGPHLLLVHGFLTGPAQWLPNLPALADHCTPVTVSLWGHAGAPSPAQSQAYTPDAYVAAFEALRASLSTERWFLLGYSLGAGLTIRYALTHPERVLGHAFTNSTSALADAEQQQAWREGARHSADRIRQGGLAAMERIPVHPRHARRLPAAVYEALCADARRHDPDGIASALEHTNPAASVRDRLGDNVRPALLLCGTRERRFRPHRGHLVEAMPLLQVADLYAGHGMNMEAPDAFNDALAGFLRACHTS